MRISKPVNVLSERVGRYLECQGLLVRDMDNSYLALEPRDECGLEQVLDSSITYRIAIGPPQGCNAFTLQTLPAVQTTRWRTRWPRRPASRCMLV
jgi:hypothetical protein